MKIDIPDMDKLVKELNALEVTSAAINQNMAEPDPEGLGSYIIFGKPGSEERSNKFGYINLNSYFLHPQVLAALKGLKREVFKDIINGDLNYYVDKGELVPIKPGNNPPTGAKAGTGLTWLHSIWDQLNFKPKADDAPATRDRKTFINTLKKNEVFITKWLVMPAFYRDIDLHTNKRNKWNSYYVKLIQLSSMIKSTSAMMPIYQTTDAHTKIQNTLEEMHRELMNFIGGTKGFIHQHVMGKPTKYSCRLVISSAKFDADREEDLDISFTKSTMPLHAVINIFQPFIAYGITKFMENQLTNRLMIRDYAQKGFPVRELDPNYMEIVSSKTLQKRIKLYEESKLHRLEPVKLKCKDGGYIIPFWYSEENFNILTTDEVYEIEKLQNEAMISKGIESDLESNAVQTRKVYRDSNVDEERVKKFKPLNWCQLFYMIAYQTVRDKIIYITRYPIEDYNNTYPSEMSIMPCTKTVSLQIDDILYPKFPNLPLMEEVTENELEHFFIDTFSLHPAYKQALNADFDGDMISVISIYTEEANRDAKKYIRSITNMGAISGSTMRGLVDIAAQTIYNITMRVK